MQAVEKKATIFGWKYEISGLDRLLKYTIILRTFGFHKVLRNYRVYKQLGISRVDHSNYTLYFIIVHCISCSLIATTETFVAKHVNFNISWNYSYSDENYDGLNTHITRIFSSFTVLSSLKMHEEPK
jgi:hypothetical protein